MAYRLHSEVLTRGASRLLGVVLIVSLGLLPVSLRTCLGAGQAKCVCCAQPVVSTPSCCSDQPAHPAENPDGQEPDCCIDLDLSPTLCPSSAPPTVRPLMADTVVFETFEEEFIFRA